MIKRLTFGGIIFLFISCATFATSMSPIEVNSTLPTLTKSKLISQAEVDEFVKANKCKYLVKNRNYVAPIGFTTKDDLKNGAKGIDEWVNIDGGNSYVLKNFEWTTVDQNGATQLRLEFDTLLCE